MFYVREYRWGLKYKEFKELEEAINYGEFLIKFWNNIETGIYLDAKCLESLIITIKKKGDTFELIEHVPTKK